MGPGTFLLINTISLLKTFTVFTPKLDKIIKDQLNTMLKELEKFFYYYIDYPYRTLTGMTFKHETEIRFDSQLAASLDEYGLGDFEFGPTFFKSFAYFATFVIP